MTTLALRDEFRRNPSLPMLVGDDVFIRGIRRGIEQGDYVYRRGDLLFGPGDPPADIRIDEQAVVMTMAYAKNKAVWPRPAPPAPGPGLPTPSSGTGEVPPGPGTGRHPAGPGGGSPPPGPGTGSPPPGPGTTTGGPVAGTTPPGPGTATAGSGGGPSPPAGGVFSAEGVLRDALVQLWEQARSKRVETIAVVKIRMFDAGDAFRLLGAVGAVSGARKLVGLTGGYETAGGGTFELEFRGPVPDAEPVKEFLQQQLRGAKSTTVEATFDLSFTEGLPMAGDAAETLTDRLCRFASGTAHVSATAEARP